ncbi:MADF domain-containing protein [Trichonephila clavipes]|nr:MADF domain-containing protein [Trichonephila clavipes]
MKWNANNISLFLQLYQQFPALWNIKDKNYCNKSLRDTVFKQLMSELEENQLLGHMDNKQLKAKIKSIKDVYRTELNKIEKSKKSGCGVDDVYVPKLTWFNEACFLSEVSATRSVNQIW